MGGGGGGGGALVTSGHKTMANWRGMCPLGCQALYTTISSSARRARTCKLLLLCRVTNLKQKS